MKVEFKKSFAKDLKKQSPDKKLISKVREVINKVEEANSILEIKNLKKLQTGGNYYRIRLGDYRMGLVIEDDKVTFVRLLHRAEVYRYFP